MSFSSIANTFVLQSIHNICDGIEKLHGIVTRIHLKYHLGKVEVEYCAELKVELHSHSSPHKHLQMENEIQLQYAIRARTL